MKAAVITGAGSGLGRSLAVRFAQLGYAVALGGRDSSKLEATLASIQLPHTGSFAFSCDVTHLESVQAFVEEAFKRLGRVDVLVNNAGFGRFGYFEKDTDEVWIELMETHVLGPARACRAAIPIMARQGGGHIVNIASMAGLVSPAMLASYSASKAALISLSEALRVEVQPQNISVTVACPATFRSELHRSLSTSDEALRPVVERILQKARQGSDEVAARIVQSVERGEFLVLCDQQSRNLYRLKRHFPRLFRYVYDRAQRKASARLARALVSIRAETG